MELWKFVKPLGIITYGLLFVTMLSGMFRWKLKKHKTIAIITLVIATLHAVIVLFFLK